MSAQDTILKHLAALVACDTRNPPRDTAASGILDTLVAALPGFKTTMQDHGDGCISLLAVRGQSDVLFNFHVDTVPAAPGWDADPLRLEVADGRAIGLGACDIKGAAACMLTAAASTSGPVALLFTTDEESGSSLCVRRFIESGPRFGTVIVAEPTGGNAVAAHRGILSARARFEGDSGHASDLKAIDQSAIHRAAVWATRALQLARQYEQAQAGTLVGLPFNIGRIEGGEKPNMIASECHVRFGFRPLPGQDPEALLRQFAALAGSHGVFESVFIGPPLPAANATGQLKQAAALIDRLGLARAPAVSFWTEASLFSAAGATAIVLGSGNIAQAHTANEWVELDQLDALTHTYQRLIDHGH